MQLIGNIAELIANLRYFDASRHAEHAVTHQGFVRRGTCFVLYRTRDRLAFAPSRFIGYQENTFELHEKNIEKDGRRTNAVLNSLLNCAALIDPEIDRAYQEFCSSLGFKANPAGARGAARKFWSEAVSID